MTALFCLVHIQRGRPIEFRSVWETSVHETDLELSELTDVQ